MTPTLHKAVSFFALAAVVSLGLAGCGTHPVNSSITGPKLKGRVLGAQQPVVNASIQLYAAGSTGYASSYPYGSGVSLLGSNTVVTDAQGFFNITGDYTCPSASTQVYLVGTGGNPIAGHAANPNLATMAALGACGNLSDSTFVFMNEVTTVGSVFALAPFMTGIAHVGSSATNAIGLANAFATVNRLVDIASGKAPGTALAGATAPASKINTLANIIETCLNSTGGTAGDGSGCGNLFALTPSAGGVSPTNTITAMLNIAQNPAQNAAALNNLPSSTAPFHPSLGSTAPNDWSLSIRYTGGAQLAGPSAIAADKIGNVWITNTTTHSVTALDPTGNLLSTGGPYASGLTSAAAIAIDPSGNAWIPGTGASLVKLNASNGGVGGSYTGGGLGSSPTAVAVDGSGTIWATVRSGDVSAFSNGGTALSPSTGYTGGGLSSPKNITITAK